MLILFASVFILNLSKISAECLSSESCIPIRSCDPIIDQLKVAKNKQGSEKRAILEQVREKICGDKEEKLICCPLDQQEVPFSNDEIYVGNMKTIYHDVQGEVYFLGDNTIKIKNFLYDGEGPDAFFLASTKGSRPSNKGDVVLPYPHVNQKLTYENKEIPILGRFDGSEDVVLKLPDGVSVSDLKWLSVWCRDYEVDFGHITF